MTFSHTFQQALDQTAERMHKAELQMLRFAITNNWTILGRGKTYEQGPELVRIAIPEKNRLHGSPDFHDFLAADYDYAIAHPPPPPNPNAESLDAYEERTGKCYDCGKPLAECYC